jgi:hypothetical protein
MVVVFKKLVLLDLKQGITTERFECDGQSVVEVQDYPDAEDVEIFDRANVQKRIGFTATRQHDTEDDAELFCNTHAEAALGKGSLLVAGIFGGWERFYNKAACTRCSCYAEGCRTWTTYEFVTGLSSKKKV